jgi:outer membrane protein assembly factor BamB
MKRRSLAAIIFCIAMPSCITCAAGDWPTWRYDAARSAAAPNGIAANPVLLWSRKLPPVRPAWPLEPNQRLDFDASYEPVVMGKVLVLASPNDGTVTAYDTETGRQRWKFYTEGPVRCAPACWKGRVYAGSDDGYLYCLDAESGKLLWKFRGAPAERPDRRQLGNGHIVSFWPVRGGPVVSNGVVYFGAGIWPIFGVFLHALDAETGQVKWSNDKLNYITGVRGQAAYNLDTGLSPQGYLALAHGRLVVPCGRSLPAGLDAATGKLVYYDQGTRRGECRVALHGDCAFVGREAMVSLDDFREIGTRSQAGYRSCKMVAGCDASAALEGGVAYGSDRGSFYAHDVANAKMIERETEFGDTVLRTWKWEPPVRWQFQTTYAGQKSGVTIKAGKRLYGSAGKTVLAVGNLAGPPYVAWEKDVDSPPTSTIAADSKLFVATAAGTIYCFGEGGSGTAIMNGTVVSAVRGAAALYPADGGRWVEKAAEIVKASRVKSGYCLVLGLADGGLVDELLKQTELLVIAVDPDAGKIDALRRRYDTAGLLGSGVELFVAKPGELVLPPYFAGLIVSEKGLSDTSEIERLLTLLRPYGGTLCYSTLARSASEGPAHIPSLTLRAGVPAGFVVKEHGNLSLVVRQGPLPGSAAWSHEGADAASTYCSQDDLVKAPLGFLWYGDVPAAAPEYPSLFNLKVEVNGGRVYTHGPQGGTFVLRVYDAFTGQSLWRKEVRTATRRASSAMLPDGIYFAYDDKCLVCDPASGETRQKFTFSIPAGQMATAVRVSDDIILAAFSEPADAGRAVWGGTYADDASSTLVCLDRRSGSELWRRAARQRFHDRALAVAAGKVFCVDSLPLWLAEKTVPKPDDLKEMQSTVIAIDARSGQELWSRAISCDSTRKFVPADLLAAVDDGHFQKLYGNDWLAYAAEQDLVVTGRFLLGSALDAAGGKPRWQNQEVRGSAPIIVRGKTLVTSGGNVYDILTGKRLENYKAVRKMACNYAIASKHLVMVRLDNASYYDADGRQAYQLRNIRSACLNNLIAADGLINSPQLAGCICNFPIQTSFAMVTMPEVAAWSGSTPLRMAPPPEKPAWATPKKQ